MRIAIVGAGLSGLTAAIALEKSGYDPVIYEATSEVGGRVKTDIVEGYQLDHGFQVLLDAYPKALEYFDYESLELQRLLPGAQIFTGKKTVTVGDPTRHFPFLLPTLEAGVAGVRDIYLLWTLHRELERMTVEEVFQIPEMTTAEFLSQRGFSEKIRRNFFIPFFSGIFLEPDLNTSCRMFSFVFKMFGKGYAVIPKKGMSALPTQLLGKLKKTEIHYNSPVKRVEEEKIILADGAEFAFDAVLIATDARGLVPDEGGNEIQWHGCDTLYFEAEKRSIQKPLIGLVANPDALVNNIFFPTSIQTGSSGPKELLSVTVVKDHDLSESELVARVEEELKGICGLGGLRFLKRYHIRKALPKVNLSGTDLSGVEKNTGNNIFLAGDHLFYGSSNAALYGGEQAAHAIVRFLGNRP